MLNINGKDVAITDRNSIDLSNVTTSGNLAVVAAGDITQTAGTSVDAAGTSTLKSTGGDIDLNNSGNTFGGSVSVAARDITLAATGNLSIGSAIASGNLITSASKDLALDNVQVAGNLAATSLHGSVFMTNSVQVAGSNTIEAPDGTIRGFITSLVMSIFRPSVAVETAEATGGSASTATVVDQRSTTAGSQPSVATASTTVASVGTVVSGGTYTEPRSESTGGTASAPAVSVAGRGSAGGASGSVTVVSQSGLSQNLDVTSSGGATIISNGKNANSAGGSSMPSDGSASASSDSSQTFSKSQMTVFVLKKGEVTTGSTGFMVEQGNQYISLKQVAAADQNPTTNNDGTVIGKVTFKLETKGGQELTLTGVVTEGGMSIQCEKGNIEQASVGYVDVLVGTALMEVQKQLDISSTRVRTVVIAF